ncbi:MAG: tyrosine--tRNA ligase, partial [Acidimicrobiia bacterium]
MASVEQQLRILTAGTVDCIAEPELAAKLGTGRPLRVKLGIDPTASDIHLGFAVVLRKLRQFQDLGHIAVLIIGDFTARVGDPTGRSATRPPLTAEQVDNHAATYVDQVRGILDFGPGRIELVRNASWLATMQMDDVLRLTGKTTVARIMERDDFSTRFADGSPIALSELLYPLLQATDSVEVRADVEIGGTDQLFNILMGRHLQAQAGQDPQVVLTTPLLEGLDGVQKMSKSLGNYIGITEPPAEQFGKLMSIPDALMPRYFQLTTGWLPEQVEAAVEDLRTGVVTPVAAKRLLA